MIRRPIPAILLALALAAVPAAAAAHVHLVSTTPGGGENLDEPPTEVSIEFDGELDPDVSTFTVTDADGTEVGIGEVDLTVADRNVLAGEVTIDEPGVYTVDWEVTGTDGHTITGSFSFGVETDEEIPEASEGDGHEPPNTAMNRPASPSPLSLLGVGLLALAAITTVRRRFVR